MSRFLLVAVLGLCCSNVNAHDTWLVSGATTSGLDHHVVELTTGHAFPELGVASKPERVARAELITATRSVPLVALTPNAQALPFRVIAGDEAMLIAVVSLRAHDVELQPDAVAQYIHGELGSDSFLLARYQSQGRWRERYTKNAKALIRTRGTGAEAIVTQPHGLAYELVPSVDPTLIEPGTAFEVCAYANNQRVTSRPVKPGQAQIHIGLLQADGTATTQRADARGCVRARPKGADNYLLRSVLILPVDKPDADWESHFTALTVRRAVIPSLPQRSQP